MTLLDSLIAIGIVFIVLAVITSKVRENSPKFDAMMSNIFTTKLYSEVEPAEEPSEQEVRQQIWNEHRAI